MTKTEDKISTLKGKVIRRPMLVGFRGAFFMTTKDGKKFMVVPSRVLANDVLRHLAEGDEVTLSTISVPKEGTTIYAHELEFRGFDLTTAPPT